MKIKHEKLNLKWNENQKWKKKHKKSTLSPDKRVIIMKSTTNKNDFHIIQNENIEWNRFEKERK